MPELTFMDELPEAPRGRAQTKERAAEIKANSPRWAQWPSQTPPSAVKKALEAIDPDFEVVGRQCADGKTRAFVRYAPVDEPTDHANGVVAKLPSPPNSQTNTSPKVKCPTCSQFINIESGEDNSKALTRHERTNPVCKSANRRRA